MSTAKIHWCHWLSVLVSLGVRYVLYASPHSEKFSVLVVSDYIHLSSDVSFSLRDVQKLSYMILPPGTIPSVSDNEVFGKCFDHEGAV